MKMMSVVGMNFGITVLALAYGIDALFAAAREGDRGDLRPEEYPTEEEIASCNALSSDWEIIDHDCFGDIVEDLDGARVVVDPYEYTGLVK